MSFPDSSVFNLKNLLTLTFHSFEEMDSYLTHAANVEGFQLSRQCSKNSISHIYYCHLGSHQKGLTTVCRNCPFRFTMTHNIEDGRFTFSTKSTKNCLQHNHEPSPKFSKILSETTKNAIRLAKKSEGANTVSIQSAIYHQQNILVSSRQIRQIVGTQQHYISPELQFEEFKKHKEMINEPFYVKLSEGKIEAIVSLFSDCSRPDNTIRLILADETGYTNSFHNYSICPLTILDKNFSNELYRYIIGKSFTSDVFMWAFTELITKHCKELKTLVSDNASALHCVPKHFKLGHMKCL